MALQQGVEPALQNLLRDELKTQQQILEAYSSAKAWLEALDREQSESKSLEDQHSPYQNDDSAAVHAVLLYVVRLSLQLSSKQTDKQQPESYGLPLSAIAAASGTNLFALFREWPVVLSKLAPYLQEQGLQQNELEALGNISEWQKTLVAVALLSKKYKDLFNRYLQDMSSAHKAVALKMGWYLFIVIKAKLLPKFPDLVSCMELLVCVMNVLVTNLDKLPSDMVAGPAGDISILDNLSDALKADKSHVHQLMLSVNPLLTQHLVLENTSWQTGTGKHPAGPHVLNTCPYLPGLLTDDSCITTVTSKLDREYQTHFLKNSEIDERDMLFMDLARFASPRMTPTTMYKQQHSFGMMPPHDHHAGHDAHGRMDSSRFLGGPQAQTGQRLGPGSFISTPPGGHGMVPAGLQSPMPIMQLGTSTATPITEALGSAAWLRHVTANLKTEPTPGLYKYFSACVPNPAATIAKRVVEMTEAVLPGDVQPKRAFPMVQPSITAYRREEAIKLYYHVLELILASEERLAASSGRPQQQQPCYTTLLTSSKLHKGLMACSLELVMACYKMVSCPFPKVLDIIKLHAFDLIKIVQTYVRHMPGMPLELKRHLYLMEEKTVEALAWHAGSSLYPLVITAMGSTGATSSCTGGDPTKPSSSGSDVNGGRGASGDTIQEAATMSDDNSSQAHTPSQPSEVLSQEPPAPAPTGNAPATLPGHTTAPSPSKRPATNTHSMMSPLKRARSLDSTAITTQAAPTLSDPLPAAVGRPPSQATLASLHPETAAALTWLHDFLRKVLKLAWFRLGFLCQSLQFGSHDPSTVRQKVYDTVEYAVYMHTNLLYNRHLDQLLLSALYGYCKVQHLGSITFKEIIAQYRRQPQATQAVFRSVVLAQSNPGLQVQMRGDIIAYYNQAFVPLMKQYLLRGEAAAHPTLGLPPMPPPLTTRQSPSPRFCSSGATGSASPRMFQPLPGTSPASSPAGRPPLPPQPSDAVAVQTAIKQTISGFFPPVPRAGGGNPRGSNSFHKGPPEFGSGLLGKSLLGGGAPGGGLPTGQPPSWPAGASIGAHSGKPGGGMVAAAPHVGGLPFPVPAPAPAVAARPAAPQDMPSGIATLLRALDQDNGLLGEDAGRESSLEEGGPQAPLQLSPGPSHAGGRAGSGVSGTTGLAAPPDGTPLASPASRPPAPAQLAAQGPGLMHGSISPEALSNVSSVGTSMPPRGVQMQM